MTVARARRAESDAANSAALVTITSQCLAALLAVLASEEVIEILTTAFDSLAKVPLPSIYCRHRLTEAAEQVISNCAEDRRGPVLPPSPFSPEQMSQICSSIQVVEYRPWHCCMLLIETRRLYSESRYNGEPF